MVQSYPYIIHGIITLNAAPQAGVTVSIKNNTKSETGTVITNASGQYALSLSDPVQFPSGYDVGDSVTVSWNVFSESTVLPAGAGTTVGGETVNVYGIQKDVVVTDEDLSIHSGFEWDEVTYTATVLDEDSNKLPASFTVNLRLDGILVVNGQVLNAGVYSQATGLLTLVWYVPNDIGEWTVDLQWDEQEI